MIIVTSLYSLPIMGLSFLKRLLSIIRVVGTHTMVNKVTSLEHNLLRMTCLENSLPFLKIINIILIIWIMLDGTGSLPIWAIFFSHILINSLSFWAFMTFTLDFFCDDHPLCHVSDYDGSELSRIILDSNFF